MNDGHILLADDKAIHAPLIPAIFPEAKELIVILRTIRPKMPIWTQAAVFAPCGLRETCCYKVIK